MASRELGGERGECESRGGTGEGGRGVGGEGRVGGRRWVGGRGMEGRDMSTAPLHCHPGAPTLQSLLSAPPARPGAAPPTPPGQGGARAVAAGAVRRRGGRAQQTSLCPRGWRRPAPPAASRARASTLECLWARRPRVGRRGVTLPAPLLLAGHIPLTSWCALRSESWTWWWTVSHHPRVTRRHPPSPQFGRRVRRSWQRTRACCWDLGCPGGAGAVPPTPPLDLPTVHPNPPTHPPTHAPHLPTHPRPAPTHPPTLRMQTWTHGSRPVPGPYWWST